MKLHGLARVKNEGDVVEEFVRHSLRYLDALTVVENASLDGTLAVLEALRAEGLPVTILHDPTLPKRQAEIMTRVARQSAIDSDWDFLFLLDADEFLKAPDRERLEESLSALSPGENGLLPLLTYVPTTHDPDWEMSVLARIGHRRAVEAEPVHYKCVLSRSFVNGGEFSICQGNHVATYTIGASAASILPNVALAHFPIRSLSQIQGKVLLGWGAYLAMGHDSPEMGWHQRRLFHELESAPMWNADDLYEMALRYSEEVISPDAPALTYDQLGPVSLLRYGNAAVRNPLQLAARYVRQLAGALAKYEATMAEQFISTASLSDCEPDSVQGDDDSG